MPCIRKYRAVVCRGSTLIMLVLPEIVCTVRQLLPSGDTRIVKSFPKALSQRSITLQISNGYPSPTFSFCWSLLWLDQRVAKLPSTAAAGKRLFPSTEDAVAGLFRAILVKLQAAV